MNNLHLLAIIGLAGVTLLTLANVVNAQGNETGTAKNDCIKVKLSNLAIVDSNCKSYQLAISSLLVEGFELKLSNNQLLYMTK